MRFLTICLLFFATLAHAGGGDYLKATIDGKPYQVNADSLGVYYDPGGELSSYQDYSIKMNTLYEMPQVLSLSFMLPPDAVLKTGAYAFTGLLGMTTSKPPYASLSLTEGPDSVTWWVENGTDGGVGITSIQGKVVEGTFHGKLRATNHPEVREVTNGTFRFTME